MVYDGLSFNKRLNKRLLICKIYPFIIRTRANGAHYDDYV